MKRILLLIVLTGLLCVPVFAVNPNTDDVTGLGIMLGMPYAGFYNYNTIDFPIEMGVGILPPYMPASAGYYTFTGFADILYSVFEIPINDGMYIGFPVGTMIFAGLALPAGESESNMYPMFGMTGNVRPQLVFDSGYDKLAVGLDIAVGGKFPPVPSPLYWHTTLVLSIGP
ncbi:MAG: hypothetical protein ACLFR1_04420 [Spirochaetia bacterium]